MFDVVLFANFAKPENSTKLPSGGETFPCQMVEPCGIIAPRISFARGNEWNPHSYNFAYIPAFERYYFVTEWTFTRGRWYVQLSIDSLGSWKTEIGNLEEYVLRSASAYDGSIIDELYPANTRVTKTTSQFNPWPASSLSTGAYVIGVLGNNQSTVGGVGYYVASGSDLNALVQKMMQDTTWINGAQAAKDIGEDLLKCLVNPMQYITSVMWLPFEPWNTGSSSRVYAGWWFTGIGLPDCGSNAPFIGGSCGSIPSHPQSGRGTYLNYTPYTEVTLEFPPFGKITLDPYKYPPGSDIRYSIATDAISGMSTLHLYTKQIGDGDMLQCKIGVDLSVGQSTSSMLGAAGSAISSLPKSKPPVMYGAAGSPHGSITGLTIGDALTALNPELNVVGQNGGVTIYSQPGALTTIHHMVVSEDNLHNGKPLCEKRKLSSLSGFTKTLDADCNIGCTLQEKQMIKGFMDGGFFYE